MPSRGDWTSGAGKWAAVVVLGAVSASGIAWGIARDSRGVQPRKRDGASAAVSSEMSPRERVQDSASSQREEPVVSVGAAKDAADSSRTVAAVKLNPNTASKPELELLPGVGPALADRIIAERARTPFRSLEDLGRVRGIGPKTLERLREHVVFE